MTVEELATQLLALLPMGEPPVLSEAQIAVVLEKFKTYGQQTPDVQKGLQHAS